MKLIFCISFLLLVLPVIHSLPTTENQPAGLPTDDKCDLDLQVSNENEVRGLFETSESDVKITFQAIKEDNQIHAKTTTVSASDVDSTISVHLSLPDIEGSVVQNIEKLIIKHAEDLVESSNCQIPTNLNVLHEELADKLYQCTKEMGMSQLRFSIMYLETVVASAQRICNGAESICTASHGEGLFMCEEDLEDIYSTLTSSYTVRTETSPKENSKEPGPVEKASQGKMKRAMGTDTSSALSGPRCSGKSGRDLGCCGNYPGPCLYCSFACYLHDVACWECDHWWCGPACIPGGLPPVSETNNAIPSGRNTLSTNSFQ